MKTIIVLLVACVGCAGLARKSNYYSINPDGSRSEKYSRVNEYSAYGTQGLGAQQTISDAYEKAQHAPPPQREVKIFNSSLPEGVKLNNGVIEIDKAANWEAVGRFEIGYWLDSAPNENNVHDDLARLAQVTDSDAVVVEVQHVAHGDPRVNYLIGFAMRSKLVALTATGPAPAKPHVRAKLAYKAPASGCLSSGEFADEVSARLGYSPWAEDAPLELSANISEKAGTFTATITTLGSPRGEPKLLTGATCRNVTDAAIAVLVVRLDE